MLPLFLSWRAATEATSWSEATLRRLVKAGVLSEPKRLGPGRVGFDRELFELEVRAHVASLNPAPPRRAGVEAAV